MKTVRHKRSSSSIKKYDVNLSAVQEAFLRFMEYHPASRFSRNLRKMLLEFMMHDGAVEALYFKDLIYDLEGLFDLLDEIEENGEDV